MDLTFDPAARYTRMHTWVRLEGELAVIGVTDYAQQQLSDVMWVDLAEIGTTIEGGEIMGVIESVKSASDAYSPVSGVVEEVNEELDTQPDLINKDPYGSAWLIKVRLTRREELDDLMDAESYAAFIRDNK